MQLKQLIFSAVIFLLLDALYFSFTGALFRQVVQNVQKEPMQFNMVGAVLAYLLLFVALNVFVLNNDAVTLSKAFLLGVVIYGVYETTNLALFKQWSPTASIIDTLWGGVVFALTTFATRQFFKTFDAATDSPPAKKQKRLIAAAENNRKTLSEYHRKFNGMSSEKAQAHFQANPTDWHHYHKLLRASYGYDTYANPQQAVPVRRLIAQFEKRMKKTKSAQKKVVVDMGCGLAEIGTHFRNSARYDVISIDYVAATANKTVVGNMRDTGLPEGSANYVVFCLSLMGTPADVETYLREARRLLDAQGEVIVVEPRDCRGRWQTAGAGENEACGKLRALLERHFVIHKTEGDNERFLYFYCGHKEE